MMTIGRRVLGLGAVLVGITGLVSGSFNAMGIPVPKATPGYLPLAYATATVLVLAGLAINLRRTAAVGGLAVAGVFGLVVLLLAAPAAAAQPMVWVSWENIAEKTLMALGGVLAYAQSSQITPARAEAIERILPRICGVCLVVFGISEFVYVKFTASLVPAWLPPSQLFWSYLTGVAQIAAGLAVVSGVQARLGAMLLTAMFLVFSLIVHLPRVIAQPDLVGAWAENGSNLVLAGAAWCLADALSRTKARRQQA